MATKQRFTLWFAGFLALICAFGPAIQIGIAQAEEPTDDDGPSTIGEPWSVFDEIDKSFAKGYKLFGEFCPKIDIEVIIWPTPYEYDTGPAITAAATHRATRTSSLIWIFPEFFRVTDRERELLIMHELGHACGLPHNYDSPESIMYPYINLIVGPGVLTEADRSVLEVIWKPRFQTTLVGIAIRN